MALESGSYINSLNAANPASTDGLAQADDHLRLIKSTVKSTFPNLTGAVTSTQADLNLMTGAAAAGVTATEVGYLDGVTSSIQTQISAIQLVPAGVILLWSGAASAIPTGWVLCDGNNSTPNLTGRFVIGANGDSGTYPIGRTGGAATVTLSEAEMPAHTHVATVTDNGHAHSTGQEFVDDNEASVNHYVMQGNNENSGTDQTTNVATTGITVSNASTGGGIDHENRPPFYALAYIMKT